MRHVFLLALLAWLTLPAAAQERYAVVIGGLGGSPEYTSTFQTYLLESRRALEEAFGIPPANIAVLAEPGAQNLEAVSDVSSAENIRAHFADLAEKVEAGDEVYVLLFGHGSFSGDQAQFNIPRRDLSSDDYAELLDALAAETVVFVNTASASGPFADALSGPGRIVITATRTGTERNETVFPQFFIEAMTSPSADLDKNGDLSVRELFVYAAEQTAQSYEAEGHLATEHALLEDTGDGEGHEVDELDEAGEGALAAVTYLKRRKAPALAAGEEATSVWREREEIEQAVAALKSRKTQLETDVYYAELETLFVRLARLNETLEPATEN